jgi:serine/threonine protein phosphatase 1
MRTLALGDIHGCSIALDRLLQAVAPTPDDLLIALGDYIDRGPDSKGVLDRLIALRRTHRLIALVGNHEEMLLDAAFDPEKSRNSLWRGCGGNQTLASYGQVSGLASDLELIPEEHWQFLREACIDWHEGAAHFFVHGNVEPDVPLDKQRQAFLRWEKLYDARPHICGKVMVCGHTRQLSGWPLDLGCAVCIDTGAYAAGGWLTCLEVETGRFVQANQKGELRESSLSEMPVAG